MAIQYGSMYVDEKYKSTLVPNLFYRTFLVPGVTYQDTSENGAGGSFWHKLGDRTSTVEPGTPGRDFTDEAAANTLIPAVFNNNFMVSKKIYGVQAAGVSFPVAEEHLALATNEVAEGRNLSALSCLITEGTASAASDAITPENFLEKVLGVRTEVVKGKGIADTVLCSPDLFATMMAFAGSKYLPTTNEKLIAAARGGQVGDYMGMIWMECNAFSNPSAAKYYNHAGTLQTVAQSALAKVDFIMYDHDAFGVGDNFQQARLIDSENFSGSKAQVEENVAYRVLQTPCVRVRSHT